MSGEYFSAYICRVNEQQNTMKATHILTNADNTAMFNHATVKWEVMTYPTREHLCDGGIVVRIAAEVNAQANGVDLGGGIRVVAFNA
jgi:hypothetical protein